MPVDVDRLATVEAKLSFTDVRKSLGYVDDERGSRWWATLRGERVNGETVPKIFGTYDYGFALPLAIPRSGRGAPPASRRATPSCRSRTSSSAASATTGSITATRSAIASGTAFRAPS